MHSQNSEHDTPPDSEPASRRTFLGAGLGGGLLAGMLANPAFASQDSSLREAAARWEILQCIYRCARGMDRNDLELAMSAYHPDALDDHGFFVGTARDFLQSAVENREPYAARQHFIANHLADIDGDVAHAETYYFAAFRRKDHEALEMYFGRYLDRFEYRDGRWAIAARVVVQESGLDPAVAKAFSAVFVQGSQDKTDPSYRRPLQVTRSPRNKAAGS